MLVGKLEDLNGEIPFVMLPGRAYDEYNTLCEGDNVLLINGRVRLNRDEVQVICEKAELLTQQVQKQVLHVELEAVEDNKVLENLKKVFVAFPGEMPVMLHTREAVISIGRKYWVRFTPDLTAKVAEVVGEARSWVG